MASLIAGALLEYGLQIRFQGSAYIPDKEMRRVQAYLQSHPYLGFMWRKNIAFDEGVFISWRDQDPDLGILSTDQHGFLNHPDAIALQQNGGSFDIVGLGDSFIHGAAYPYWDYFKKRSITYLNLAMHRHSPPQYNIILTSYAVQWNPKLVVYGFYINDFFETLDFLEWQNSGEDWFTFHSGYWCGPAANLSLGPSVMWKYLPGIYTSWRYVNSKGAKHRLHRLKIDMNHAFNQTIPYLDRAANICAERQIDFLLMLIPSKRNVLHGDSAEDQLYDMVVQRCREHQISYADLRTLFRERQMDESLYLVEDAHWNRNGMLFAANVIEAYYNYRQTSSEH